MVWLCVLVCVCACVLCVCVVVWLCVCVFVFVCSRDNMSVAGNVHVERRSMDVGQRARYRVLYFTPCGCPE